MTSCCAFVASWLRACCALVAETFDRTSAARRRLMDDRFQEILDGMPEKTPRSTLEPYRELISELRRRGRTYREIAHILADKFRLRVAASTIYRFVRKQTVTR